MSSSIPAATSASSTPNTTTILHKARLLHDIHELSTYPYPYITFHPHAHNLTRACLLLSPPTDNPPIHLTVLLPETYPLTPPQITIQTKIAHPNVFGDYICASILNTANGYTPAYTLKGIAIQMLSFFNSEKVQQQYGNPDVDLKRYQRQQRKKEEKEKEEKGKKSFIQRNVEKWLLGEKEEEKRFTCEECGFPDVLREVMDADRAELEKQRNDHDGLADRLVAELQRFGLSSWRTRRPSSATAVVEQSGHDDNDAADPSTSTPVRRSTPIAALPSEILIRICDFLHMDDLYLFMCAWDKIGGVEGIVTTYDLIRKRELLCFVTKEDFTSEKIGVGVRVRGVGRIKNIESEFDLLSEKAYQHFHVRKSVHGIGFAYWLPLPLSWRHYQSVKGLIEPSLMRIGTAAGLAPVDAAETLIAFMNDVVVKLSTHASIPSPDTDPFPYSSSNPPLHNTYINSRSSLVHASEKAIESYYHLFHLLLCLAADSPTLLTTITRRLTSFFTNGNTAKTNVPNLSHLLPMLLLCPHFLDTPPRRPRPTSSTPSTSTLPPAPPPPPTTSTSPDAPPPAHPLDHNPRMTLIREAITRNVVWMLEPNPKGAGKTELAYMEADAVSAYRLRETYAASRTSYRLLMFAEVFRRSVSGNFSGSDSGSGAGNGNGGAAGTRRANGPAKGAAPAVSGQKEGKEAKKATPPRPTRSQRITQLRDVLFGRLGAPPGGAAAQLAAEIRRLEAVDSFPEFLTVMGLRPVELPRASWFTTLLRGCVEESMRRGYSVWGVSQAEALEVRKGVEPRVGVREMTEGKGGERERERWRSVAEVEAEVGGPGWGGVRREVARRIGPVTFFPKRKGW